VAAWLIPLVPEGPGRPERVLRRRRHSPRARASLPIRGVRFRRRAV